MGEEMKYILIMVIKSSSGAICPFQQEFNSKEAAMSVWNYFKEQSLSVLGGVFSKGEEQQ
jgi:hypothetical protein